MKHFFSSLAIISICYLQLAELSTDEQTKELDKIRSDCVQQTGVDAAVLERAQKNDFANDAKLKEHVLCVALRHQFVKDGQLQKEQIVKRVGLLLKDEGLSKDLYAKCSGGQEAILEATFALAQCFLKAAHIPIL